MSAQAWWPGLEKRMLWALVNMHRNRIQKKVGRSGAYLGGIAGRCRVCGVVIHGGAEHCSMHSNGEIRDAVRVLDRMG